MTETTDMNTAANMRTISPIRKITIVLRISADEYLQFYRGVRQVSARSTDGQQVVLPAKVLRPFVTHNGISGTFTFSVSAQGKLLDIRQVA
ncbi:MAG: DUF2835 family protein [Kofleriaceae bacterium]|nr:DUF2835 family protein [Kofleriaceae bacterium]